jgi:NAD(P)-dependent dehydrogenase (short-subunit alcohol dehydrogenase family)
MPDDIEPQQQPMPGYTERMQPRPDHGEESYFGRGRLEGKKTIITGADSGIGRAVAIAFAREGADVLISYLSEDEDAEETARLVEEAGRQAVVVRGDLRDQAHCREVIDTAVEEFGRIDVLVSNAAYQASFARFEDITAEEWRKTFETNVDAFFHLVQAALPHIREGGSIIGTTSINADQPSPDLLPYATTKGTMRDFIAGLGQMLADCGIRVNGVAPGPVWTPLIPSTMPPEKVENFGKNTPIGRPG